MVLGDASFLRRREKRRDFRVSVPLSTLAIGTTFRVAGLKDATYVLLKLGLCSALVRSTERKVVASFTTIDKDVEAFTRAGKCTRISLATSVIAVRG